MTTLTVEEFGRRLRSLGPVSDLLVAGSLATGDHIPGVSDLDLVAIVTGPVDPAAVAEIHGTFDEGLKLGCVYVDERTRLDVEVKHPTWTHGLFVQRILSGVTRAELVRHGYAVFGRPPLELFPPMSDDDLRAAARAELADYWSWAARRPRLWRDPAMADLSLTSMARGRHTLAHGSLLTKSAAIEESAAPEWLRAQLRARRRGEPVVSPRWRTALIAWRDVRRTVASLS
ncbi:nucleotidyltransferase domain-containing protein [Actinoplanes sp. NPDC051633]|uniref:nucleotidyltransferase domain-containing protein n=1 Tax=Actinoplanes sp. NPDC051633 TaxID=3155670 RepID=UPI00343ED0B1